MVLTDGGKCGKVGVNMVSADDYVFVLFVFSVDKCR